MTISWIKNSLFFLQPVTEREYGEFLSCIRHLFEMEETSSVGNSPGAAAVESVAINVPAIAVPLRAMQPIAVPPLPPIEGQERVEGQERGDPQLTRNSRLIRTFFRRQQYFNQN